MTNQLTTLFANTAYLQQLNQRLPVIISLLLVIACAHTLASITWMLLPEDDAGARQRVISTAPVIRQVDQRQAIFCLQMYRFDSLFSEGNLCRQAV